MAARKSKPTGKWQEGSSATPVTTSLGLPNRYSRPQPPPLDTIAFGTDAISTSPTTPTLSAVSTLSDFTITDPSDDESPADLKTVTRHGTLYLEDGNVEVLCGGILFRVHTSVMSLHSTALRQVFTQTTPASAESPNGCPRIRSSDTATDFAVLLNMIYRPGCVAQIPRRRTVLLKSFGPQISRTKQGTQFYYVLVPPPNRSQVRVTYRTISTARGCSRRVPGSFRGARFCQAAWGECL